MIRHIHFYVENSEKMKVVSYIKYKNFIDEEYRFMDEFSFDSAEVALHSYSLKDFDELYDTIADDLLKVKKHFSKAITFSRTQEIDENQELRNVTDEALAIINEYVTNEEHL